MLEPPSVLVFLAASKFCLIASEESRGVCELKGRQEGALSLSAKLRVCSNGCSSDSVVIQEVINQP